MANDLENGQKRKITDDNEVSVKQTKQQNNFDFWENILKERNFEPMKELIFQHWTFKDVIVVSSLSTFWHSTTGKSQKCMEKFQINIGKDKQNENDLKETKRNYKKLKLHSLSESIIDHLLKHNQWTQLNLLIGSLTDKELLKLLNIFSTSIKEIEFYLEDLISPENERPLPVVDFPCLETVVFRWTPTKLFELFFGENNRNLKNVEIELKQSGTHEDVKKFLCRNKTIKNLSVRLCHEDLLDFFDEDFTSKHQLKMKILSFHWRNTLFVGRKVKGNFEKFLLSQKDCLERLVLEATFNCKNTLELIVNEMQALKHLTLVDLDPILIQEGLNYNFRPNHSIVQIDVCVKWFVFEKMFEEIVLAAPNLDILYIFELTLETMKFLAENARKLRHLVYEEIEEDCEEFYSNLLLDSDKADTVNSSIQISWEQDFELDYPELHAKMQFS